MKIIISIFLIFSISFHAFAEECTKPVTVIKKGQAAPCDGFLFSPKKEQEVRIKVQSTEILEQLSSRQKDSINNLDARLKNMREYNLELNKQLDDRDRWSFWKKTLYFGLGVAVTGAIAANVR